MSTLRWPLLALIGGGLWLSPLLARAEPGRVAAGAASRQGPAVTGQGPGGALPTLGAEPGEVVPMDPEEAWGRLLGSHPRVRAARARLGQAEAGVGVASAPTRVQVRGVALREQVRTALGAPLQVPLFGSSGPFQVQPVSYGATRAELEVRQLLLDGGRSSAGIGQARELEGRAGHEHRGALQQLRLEFKEAWLGSVEAEGRWALAMEARELAQAQLCRVEARFQAGLAPRAEVVYARVPVSQARLEERAAWEARDQARVGLNRLLGLGFDTRLELAPVLEAWSRIPLPERMEEGVLEAWRDRPDLAAAARAVGAARQGIRVAEGGNQPVVQLVGSYQGVGYDRDLLPESPGWNLSLQVHWSVLDGRLSDHQAAQARAGLDEAQALEEEARQQVAQEVRAAWLRWEGAGLQLEQAEVALEQAREALAMAEGRYEAGVSSFLEVSQARIDWNAARQQRLGSQCEVARSAARLERALGRGLWAEVSDEVRAGQGASPAVAPP